MQNDAEFLELIRQNQGIILKLAGLYAQSSHDRQDLYQEVLYQAWKSFPNFRGDARFSTWLYRISLNTIFTMMRKTPPVKYVESFGESFVQGQAKPIQQEDSQQLWAAIRQLPETDRALITLHLDGYSNAEIADIIGINTNNTGVKLHRIKTSLHQLLQPAQS